MCSYGFLSVAHRPKKISLPTLEEEEPIIWKLLLYPLLKLVKKRNYSLHLCDLGR